MGHTHTLLLNISTKGKLRDPACPSPREVLSTMLNSFFVCSINISQRGNVKASKTWSKDDIHFVSHDASFLSSSAT